MVNEPQGGNMVEGHKCYYCQGSLLYTFCEKYRELDITKEECETIMSELNKLQELGKRVEDLEKKVADMGLYFV